MKPKIGITDSNRQAVANELSKILADETILYLKTKNAHWNIEGEDFFEKYKFFESQIEQLDEVIDSVAERIRSIGHYPPATLQSYLSLTHLTEKVTVQNDSQVLIEQLLETHESIIVILRDKIKLFANDYLDLVRAIS